MTTDNYTGTLTILRADVNMEGNYVCVINTEEQESVRSLPAFVNIISEWKIIENSIKSILGSVRVLEKSRRSCWVQLGVLENT